MNTSEMLEQKSKFGQWFAAQPEFAHGWWVVSTDPDGYDTVDESSDGRFQESTARFIAAAPDLLESLIELLDQDENGEDEIWVRTKAKKAIRKALGQE